MAELHIYYTFRKGRIIDRQAEGKKLSLVVGVYIIQYVQKALAGLKGPFNSA